MTIIKSIDVEDALRQILSPYVTAYVRPLPKDFTVPSVLVTAVGGRNEDDWSGKNVADKFTVNLSSRAETEAAALDLLTTAIGIIKASAGGIISRAEINANYSWGQDSNRPDLALCGATLIITARPKENIVKEI